MSGTAGKNALTFYRRILRIDYLISSGTFPTLQDFIDDEEVAGTRSTIFRTLEFMRDQLNAPIEFDNENKGYCYSEKAFRLPAVFTSEQEMFAVQVLQNLISKVKGTPLYDSAKSLLELLQSDTVKNPMSKNFLREFDSHDDANLSWADERYIFLNDSFLKIDNDVWEKLKNAMKSSRTVTFEYRKQNANNSEKRTVAPYQIVNSNNNWYLWGFDYRRNENRTFLLNRITSLSLTAKKFTLPSDFDFRNHSTGFYGAYSSNNFKKFKVKFSKEVSDYIKTHEFGRNQKIKTNKDGSLDVSFEASEFVLVLRTILSYGTDAVPLAPKDFVGEWKKKVHVMNEIAEKN